MAQRSSPLQLEIAAAAARLIAEEGCDYASAKRKAARAVLGDAEARVRLPDNALVEGELRTYLRTFAGDTQPAVLAALRSLAADLMRRLAAFSPHLVGAVLNGTATAHSNIVVHLFAESEKDVEIFLLNEGIDFEAAEPDEDSGALEHLHFVVRPDAVRRLPPRVGVVLTVFELDAIRIAPRGRSADPTLHVIEASGRASLSMLRQLIDVAGAA